MEFASKHIDIDALRDLDAERTRSLGPWDYAPASRGYITTIFGRYQSGEPCGIAYTTNDVGGADGVYQQNADAAFICAAANSIGPLLDERAEMMRRIARLREALTYALPLVEKWCHTQGDHKQFHEETLAPIRAALAKACPTPETVSGGNTGDGQ